MKKTVTTIVCLILFVCVFSDTIEGVTGVSSMLIVAGLALGLGGAIWLQGFWDGLTTPDDRPLRRRPSAGAVDRVV